jgi:LemA protein
MKYERETLEKITAARTACIQAKSVGESAQKEGELSGLLKNLFAVAENYPDLKANQNFLQLQQRVSYLESQIADRREFYNDSVNSYNIRINQIPDLWVARALKMTPKELFKIGEEDRRDVDIKFDFPK